MRTLTNGFAVLAIACAFCGVDAAERNANTDWMSGKVGCFMHWWPQGTNNLAAQWRDFDVSGLVVQLKEMKADYWKDSEELADIDRDGIWYYDGDRWVRIDTIVDSAILWDIEEYLR